MSGMCKRIISLITITGLISTMFIGINSKQSIETDASSIQSGIWYFTQGGVYAPDWETEAGNVGYINSVSLTSNELISYWSRDTFMETTAAKKEADGFTIDIENTGWDSFYANNGDNRINPWSIQARNSTLNTVAGHDYTVTFTAKASKKKYCYVAFSTDTGMTPYEEAGFIEGSDNQLIVLGTTEKTYTYKFTNWVSGSEIYTTFLLGAFNAQLDYAGNDVSDIITELEYCWKGTVTISDFSISDEGKNKDFEDFPEIPSGNETETITEQPSTKEKITTNTQPTSKKEVTTNKDDFFEDGEDFVDEKVTTNTQPATKEVVENTNTSKRNQIITAKSLTKTYSTNPFALNAVTSGDGKLIYASSNTNVVKVSSDGKVTMKGYGTSTVTIVASATNKYNAAFTQIMITVKPPKGKLTKAKSAKKAKLILKWKKNSKATGYEVQLSSSKTFKRGVLYRRFKKSKTGIAVSMPGASGMNYYVRIRIYKKSGRKTYYGAWSKVKKVKIR